MEEWKMIRWIVAAVLFLFLLVTISKAYTHYLIASSNDPESTACALR